jgi:hypothetical protein
VKLSSAHVTQSDHGPFFPLKEKTENATEQTWLAGEIGVFLKHGINIDTYIRMSI